jgi:predicted alpha/beta hydrolase family esterase
MKTLILPGFSIHNKAWADQLSSEFIKNDMEATVVYWDHWKTGQLKDFNEINETDKIVDYIDKDTVNIVAKSIGTFITMKVLEKIPGNINKIVLCGIPVNDINDEMALKYNSLKNFDSFNALVIQNDKDPHGSAEQIKQLVHNINSKIKLIVTPGDTHEYFYFDEIIKFVDE